MKTTTKACASLLFNNLSTDEKHVGYVHGSEVVVTSESAVSSGQSSPAVTKVSEKDGALVEQARFVRPPDAPAELLVVASRKTLSIYTSDGKRLLHSVALGSTPTEERYLPRPRVAALSRHARSMRASHTRGSALIGPSASGNTLCHNAAFPIRLPF